jgi:hypothetical protein
MAVPLLHDGTGTSLMSAYQRSVDCLHDGDRLMTFER